MTANFDLFFSGIFVENKWFNHSLAPGPETSNLLKPDISNIPTFSLTFKCSALTCSNAFDLRRLGTSLKLFGPNMSGTSNPQLFPNIAPSSF